MTLSRFILSISFLLAAVVIESLAQNSSSASQTVTFGIRRSASIVLAGAQSSAISVQESGVERSSPLKVSIGSESRSLLASAISYASAEEPTIGNKPSFSAAKSYNIKSAASRQSVVTLTE